MLQLYFTQGVEEIEKKPRQGTTRKWKKKKEEEKPHKMLSPGSLNR